MAVLKFNYRVFRPRTLSSIAIGLRSFSSSSRSSSVNSGVDLKQSSWLGHDRKGLPLSREPSDRNVQWVFLGCPGVGKGTYASRLSNLLGVPHIATGDLVREELSSAGSQVR